MDVNEHPDPDPLGALAPRSARRNADGPGWIYVMQNPHAPHLVKIGLARDPRKRLSIARLFAPEMRILAVARHDKIMTAERELHSRLLDARAYGTYGFHEWFYTDHPLVQAYLRTLQPYEEPRPKDKKPLPPPK